MKQAHNVTATFNTAPVTNQNLTVSVAGTGNGAVTSNPAGINCPSDCSQSYPNRHHRDPHSRPSRRLDVRRLGWRMLSLGHVDAVHRLDEAGAGTSPPRSTSSPAR